MNMYATPLRGGYTYRTRNFDGTFNTFYTTVEVLGETAASFLIRILVPLGGHKAKSTMTVRRHNVRLHTEPNPAEEKPRHDYSDAWWNN